MTHSPNVDGSVLESSSAAHTCRRQARSTCQDRTALLTYTIIYQRVIICSQNKVTSFAHNLIGLQGMEVCGSIPELEHTPVCMDCWRRPTSATQEVLAVGDMAGYVTLFNLQENASEQQRSESRSADALCIMLGLHLVHSSETGHIM